MERANAPQPESCIDITDLSDFLRSDWCKQFNFDGHRMQLVEEVTFLCASQDFIKDIEAIRKRLLKKYPKLNLPVSNRREAERILRAIYFGFYEPYKKSIKALIQKYKLLSHIYWQDKFFLLDDRTEDEIEDAKDNDEEITKGEARFRAMEELLEDFDLVLLDNIIIRNKPFSKDNVFLSWANPYFTRKISELSSITININKEGMNELEISFPPYATLPEMQALLKKNYKKIQEYREAHLPLTSKRDHRKDNLPKMIDAYMLDIQGKSKAEIANVLDERYGGNTSFEAISQLVSRMKTEASRFSKGKQET